MGQEAQAAYVRLLGRLSGVSAWSVNQSTRNDDDSEAVDCRRILLALLKLETGVAEGAAIAFTLSRFGPAAQESEAAGRLLLRLGNGAVRERDAVGLFSAMLWVCPKSQFPEVRQQVLRKLAQVTVTDLACALVIVLGQLGMTAGERAEARTAVLALLGSKDYLGSADTLERALWELAPSPDELGPLAEEMLLRALGSNHSLSQAREVAVALRSFIADPTVLAPVRWALLARLARETEETEAAHLVLALMALEPEPDDVRDAREALLRTRGDYWTHGDVVAAALESVPFVPADLQHLMIGGVPEGEHFLVSARRRSTVGAWIEALQSLPVTF